jgi:hypothetical protein
MTLDRVGRAGGVAVIGLLFVALSAVAALGTRNLAR